MATNLFSVLPRIYFIKDAERIVGRHRLTLRRMWIQGKFPHPKMINNRLCWGVQTIEDWLDKNV